MLRNMTMAKKQIAKPILLLAWKLKSYFLRNRTQVLTNKKRRASSIFLIYFNLNIDTVYESNLVCFC